MSTVKGVGSIVTEIYPPQSTKGAAGNGDFQKIWSSQMNRGVSGNATSAADERDVDYSKKADKVDTSGDEVKQEPAAKVKDKEHVKDEANVSESKQTDGELTKEELEEAMEKLGTAAMELMQQIADAFGITMEELQAAMKALGMENGDVMDVSKLSGLLLNLGGANDTYALITDEALYEKYRMLMQQMEATLQECADALGVDAQELLDAMKQELEAADVESDLQGMGSQTMETVSEVAEAAKGENALNDNAGEDQNAADNMDMKQNAYGVAQNVSGDQFQTQIQQTESVYASSSWDMDTQNIMRQIMDYMKLQMGTDTTSLEMQLRPESLGTLQVNVASKGGVITANFITENEAVKAVLESQMIQLKESFAEQGVKVEAIEVTVQTHEFERNLEQGRGRDPQESEKKNRTRRINLNDPISMDILDTMEEEDVLAAEMLKVNGGTVDYTA